MASRPQIYWKSSATCCQSCFNNGMRDMMLKDLGIGYHPSRFEQQSTTYPKLSRTTIHHINSRELPLCKDSNLYARIPYFMNVTQTNYACNTNEVASVSHGRHPPTRAKSRSLNDEKIMLTKSFIVRSPSAPNLTGA